MPTILVFGTWLGTWNLVCTWLGCPLFASDFVILLNYLLLYYLKPPKPPPPPFGTANKKNNKK